jgi:ATP-binding cassette, subfamily B, bacterial
VKVYLRSSWFIISQTFAASPGRTVFTMALSFVMAAIPAMQVLAIAALVNSLTGADGLDDVMVPLLWVVLIVGLSGPVRVSCANIRSMAMTRSGAALQTRLARRIARMHPSELVKPATTTAIEKHNRVISEQISWQFEVLVAGVLEQTLAVVGVVITLFAFSKLAGLLVILALIPPLVSAKILGKVQVGMWEGLGKLFGRERYLRDLLVREKTATELSGLGTSGRVADMVEGKWREAEVVRDKMSKAVIAHDWVIGIISTVLLVGAMGAVVVGLDYGPDSVAGVYGVMAAMGSVGAAAYSLGDTVQNAPQTEEVRVFFAAEDHAERGAQLIVPTAGQIVARSLRHRYSGAEDDSLKDVSVEARRGEIIALVGVNGAGKTTTVNALLGLTELSGGSVAIDGRTQEEMSEDLWLGHFGLLTQEFGRYEMTVREAICLGTPRTDVRDEEVWAALESAHAAGLVRKFPDGLDTQLGEQWGGLGVSGGQWQRLALARIYLRDAAIWVLDEPTSAIDAEAEQEIFHELARTRQDRITIVVSHRAWTLKGMDRIYVIDDGAVVQQGTYEDLLGADGRFREIFSEQLSGAGAPSIPAGEGIGL